MRRRTCSPLRRLLRSGHRHAVDDDVARARRQHARRHLGDGRFPAAGFAHQREGLAPGDGEAHVADRRQQLARQALGQPVEPRLGDVEAAAEMLGLDQRRRASWRARRGGGRIAIEPAGDLRGCLRLQPWPLRRARRERLRAARVERAARRDCGEPRHGAANLHRAARPRGRASGSSPSVPWCRGGAGT